VTQPRIQDIAKLVGLSPATVSMVLNNRPGFSEETRTRVLAAAKELNYQNTPSKRAASDTGESLPFVVYKRHGEVIGETPFFSRLIESVESEAKRNGYHLSVHYLRAQDDSLAKSLSSITAHSNVGLLALGTEMILEDAEILVKTGIPFVLIDNAMIGVSCNKVLIDNQQGAYVAVNRFYESGHRKIGYLHSSVWINNFEEREAGFRFALHKHGLECRPEWMARIGSRSETAYQEMLSFLDSANSLPTAFFADNDIIAIGAIRALKERGYRVPDDISVIGFDDMPYCTMLTPNLSTMRVNTGLLGSIAVRTLLDRKDYYSKIVVETEYRERDSVWSIQI
jgi:LacI family transcriptional regulator